MKKGRASFEDVWQTATRQKTETVGSQVPTERTESEIPVGLPPTSKSELTNPHYTFHADTVPYNLYFCSFDFVGYSWDPIPRLVGNASSSSSSRTSVMNFTNFTKESWNELSELSFRAFHFLRVSRSFSQRRSFSQENVRTLGMI